MGASLRIHARSVDLGVALVVFEPDRSVGHLEDEGAEGAVVVLPAAVIVIEVVPGEGFDRRFRGLLREERSCVVRDQLNFGIRRERDPLIAGVPGLDALDLTGIAGAVVIVGYTNEINRLAKNR
jgi:hypothetical protein